MFHFIIKYKVSYALTPFFSPVCFTSMAFLARWSPWMQLNSHFLLWKRSRIVELQDLLLLLLETELGPGSCPRVEIKPSLAYSTWSFYYLFVQGYFSSLHLWLILIPGIVCKYYTLSETASWKESFWNRKACENSASKASEIKTCSCNVTVICAMRRANIK